MGYYVTLEEANFIIPADKLEEAAARLKALNHKPGVEKRGGSWGAGGKTASWFSWMDEDYDQKLHTAKEIFEALGFEVSDTEDGGISLDYYDSKSGQEDLFINEVKHLANSDWYLIWRGEDGEVWRDADSGTEKGKIMFRSDVKEALQVAYNAGRS